MKALRVTVHSLVLTMADMAGILGGFAVFKALGVGKQMFTQLPVAVVLSLLLFSAWILLLQALAFRKAVFACRQELLCCGAISLAWNPLIFVPLHYLTQGYVTSAGNLIALALYQLPVNALALAGAWGLQNLRAGAGTPQD